MANGVPRLQTEQLASGYGRKQVLEGVSVEVAPGEIVAILGHNGAGKTTLLETVFGLVKIQAGKVRLEGRELIGKRDWHHLRARVAYAPAERAVFGNLTVGENLELGAFLLQKREDTDAHKRRVLEMFPILGKRKNQRAGTLSGGQQRMLSIGIALMKNPSVLLLDEPSLGLAPVIVEELMGRIHKLSGDQDISVILVEQNVPAALRVADRAYFMRTGRIILEEDAQHALARGQWWDLF